LYSQFVNNAKKFLHLKKTAKLFPH